MKIDDSVELRNGDMDKVMGTVANVALYFWDANNDILGTWPLSRKAQEAKIFLERNPIPKEFLKS